jgi:uncharacterized membrane protein
MGRWDLAVEAGFLLLLQFTGIGIAGTVAFRVLGVGPRGQRYPLGSRGGSRVAFGALAAAFAGLLAWQFGSLPPALVRAGLQEQAREVVQSALRGDPGVLLLSADATFPRPGATDRHPLLVRVYVQGLAGSPDAPALERRLAAELEGALRRDLSGVTPLVAVTVVKASP